jgi:hypothetical protein
VASNVAPPSTPKKTVVKFYVSDARYSWLWTRFFPDVTQESDFIVIEGYHAGAELWILPQPTDSGREKQTESATKAISSTYDSFMGCTPMQSQGVAALWPLGPREMQVPDRDDDWYDGD